MTTEESAPVAGLGGVLRRGALISGVALVVVQVVALVQVLVLARLLDPAEIGLFAAGTVVSTFLLVVTENGLCNALVQRRDDVEDAAETVFWFTLAAGAVVTLVALASAPLVGMFFDSPVAGALAAATAGTVMLHAMTVVPDYLMQRRFDFRRRLIVDPVIAVSHAGTAIVLAALGMGLWALAIASYAQMVSWVVATWALGGWRPRRARLRPRLAAEMAVYSLPMLLSGVAARGRDMLEVAAVGRALSESALGQYRYGRRLSMLPGVAVVQVASYVLFPAFSRISGDRERFRRAYLRTLAALWFAATPVAGLTVAIGEPAVVVLLGERWREAGVALALMSGFGLGEALGAVGQESIMGSGRSRRLHGITITGLVSAVLLLLLAVPYGLPGFGLAVSGSAILMGATALALSRTVVGASLRDLAVRLGPPLVGAAVTTVLIGGLDRLAVRSDTHGTVAGVGLLVLLSLAFGTVYLALMRVLAPTLTVGLVSSALRPVRRRLRRASGGPPSVREPAEPLRRSDRD